MSLQTRILNLISGITDPTLRIDVSSTVNYLFSLYAGGSASEVEVRDALEEVCVDVISATHPELAHEEVVERSKILTDEFIKAFKLESSSKRMRFRFAPKLRP